MGKISDYANVLKSKLTDLFVVYQRNNGELETKNATLEQLGDAICGEQVHATLETDDQTIIGGINEVKQDKAEVTNVAPDYDPTEIYNTGDLVIHDDYLHIANTDNITGTWDSTKWTQTNLAKISRDTATAIGDVSSLTTTADDLAGAVNEVNNLPRPSVSLAVARSDVQTWNTSLVINQRSGTVNTFFVFKNNSTAQPTITHSINCSRTITGLRLVAYNAISERSTDATYDAQTGNIVWGTGLPSGVWLVMGTITYS